MQVAGPTFVHELIFNRISQLTLLHATCQAVCTAARHCTCIRVQVFCSHFTHQAADAPCCVSCVHCQPAADACFSTCSPTHPCWAAHKECKHLAVFHCDARQVAVRLQDSTAAAAAAGSGCTCCNQETAVQASGGRCCSCCYLNTADTSATC